MICPSICFCASARFSITSCSSSTSTISDILNLCMPSTPPRTLSINRYTGFVTYLDNMSTRTVAISTLTSTDIHVIWNIASPIPYTESSFTNPHRTHDVSVYGTFALYRSIAFSTAYISSLPAFTPSTFDMLSFCCVSVKLLVSLDTASYSVPLPAIA